MSQREGQTFLKSAALLGLMDEKVDEFTATAGNLYSTAVNHYLINRGTSYMQSVVSFRISVSSNSNRLTILPWPHRGV